MPLTKLDLREIFSFHQPDSPEIDRMQIIRNAAFGFASIVLDNTPASSDQTESIRKIREAVMLANSSIVLQGKF